MDWIDYRKKLGLGIDNQQCAELFFTRMFNALVEFKYAASNQISSSEYFEFCRVTGTEMNHGILSGEGYMLIVNELLKHRKNICDFISYYIAFVNCQEDDDIKQFTASDFIKVISKSLNESHIQFEILADDDGVFIFPKGAKELDDALVSAPLEWLAAYPEAHTAFVKALKAYSEVMDTTASDVADKFRKALETFFQNFFGGGKSLENYKSDYGTYLKSQSVPSEISANLETLLKAYTSYMNSYAKHHDKASMNVLEYIMYQTGNIIRLLITLKQEETANAD